MFFKYYKTFAFFGIMLDRCRAKEYPIFYIDIEVNGNCL